jgi:hypothetical protein
MVATKDEIIEALKGALDECRGDKAVEVPVLFLEDVLAALTGEEVAGDD